MTHGDDRYRWLYRNCPALIGSIDAEGRYVDASDAYLERLGYAREEVIGRRPQEHMTPEAARRMSEEYLPRFLRTGVLTNVPMDRIAKDGEVVEFMMNAIAERDADRVMPSESPRRPYGPGLRSRRDERGTSRLRHKRG